MLYYARLCDRLYSTRLMICGIWDALPINSLFFNFINCFSMSIIIIMTYRDIKCKYRTRTQIYFHNNNDNTTRDDSEAIPSYYLFRHNAVVRWISLEGRTGTRARRTRNGPTITLSLTITGVRGHQWHVPPGPPAPIPSASIIGPFEPRTVRFGTRGFRCTGTPRRCATYIQCCALSR